MRAIARQPHIIQGEDAYVRLLRYSNDPVDKKRTYSTYFIFNTIFLSWSIPSTLMFGRCASEGKKR